MTHRHLRIPVALILLTAIARADDALVVQVYDVRDILTSAATERDDPPSFPLGAGPGDRHAPPTKEQVQITAAATESLLLLVRESADAASWKAGGEVKHLDRQLVVKQTPANHKRIAAVLGELREARGVQLVIETKILQLDPAHLKDLDLRPAAPHDPAQWGVRVGMLSEEQAKTVLAAAQQDKSASILSAPRVTTFDRQKAWVKIGEQSAYVKSYEWKDGDYRPVVEVAESGLALSVQGTLSIDAKYTKLAIRAELSKVLEMKSAAFVPAAGQPAPTKKLEIQTPQCEIRRAETTVVAPAGQWVALHGLRIRSDKDAERVDDRILILVRTTAVKHEE